MVCQSCGIVAKR